MRVLMTLFLLHIVVLSGCNSAVPVIGAVATNRMTSDSADNDEADAARTRAEASMLFSLVPIGNSGVLGDAAKSAAGYVVGNEVAKRKKAYKNKERLIDAEAERTAKLITEVKEVNTTLRKDIKRFRQLNTQLRQQMKQDSSKKAELKAEQETVDKRHKQAQQALRGVENELATTQKLYDDTQGSTEAQKKQAEMRQWEKRIGQLKKEKVALERNTAQLQAVSQSMAI